VNGERGAGSGRSKPRSGGSFRQNTDAAVQDSPPRRRRRRRLRRSTIPSRLHLRRRSRPSTTLGRYLEVSPYSPTQIPLVSRRICSSRFWFLGTECGEERSGDFVRVFDLLLCGVLFSRVCGLALTRRRLGARPLAVR
jgi:hypothetical protein